MILFINTSQTNLIQLKLIKNDKIIGSLDNYDEFKHSELLLGMIDKLISAKGGPASGGKFIKLIAVVSGPGAFSALRLGVTTANTMAWALKVPIVELSADDVSSDDALISAINKKIEGLKDYPSMRLGTGKINDFQPIVPKYGKEPNITQPKNS